MNYTYWQWYHFQGIDKIELETVLKKASMKDNKTVIITTLNEAWAKPHSIFDLFLEGFQIGNNTQRLLNHLLVICLDEEAYNHCLALHPHCYNLRTKLDFSSEAFFKAPDYIEMMWRRLEVLVVVLDKGYNFVFTVFSLLFFSPWNVLDAMSFLH